ncbi:molybdenum ABC transporter permease [Marinobacter sp. ES-1]|jgi:molybdate transport system permease protein|uniref:molybdate ABC transporter permease subunit n=1 Tax=Marinobacter sp. ES-1 TaxID=1396858 RepID=UPI0003B83872|nr:molybdate ABC transporter permease subunit [Marinobacter sp. ES-1]ERP88172.1 molybdenum ABC transporter permease [Marinobacter sp. ES-1]
MLLAPGDITALWVTLKLAVTSTFFLLLLSIPLAWWLARTRSRLKVLIEALVALPLVLPPTVMGFYLLVLLGPRGVVGGFTESLGLGHLAFTFTGLVLGSMLFSLPFVVQPLQNAFAMAGGRMLEVAATLRASPIDRFISVVFPLARSGFLTAGVLSFAHTLGEFGMILMIGGNIPGRTQVASIAIYDHVEAMDYGAAHQLSLILVVTSLILLTAVFALNRRFKVVSL